MDIVNKLSLYLSILNSIITNMKTLSKLCLIITLVALFSSCYFSSPVAYQVPDNNPTYNVDYLFEHDGCKVYRFYDRGNYVYFTNCRGDVTSVKNDSTAERVINSIRIIDDDLNERQPAR
jgi:phosphoglycerate-specific signal transduction histidine kinase